MALQPLNMNIIQSFNSFEYMITTFHNLLQIFMEDFFFCHDLQSRPSLKMSKIIFQSMYFLLYQKN